MSQAASVKSNRIVEVQADLEVSKDGLDNEGDLDGKKTEAVKPLISELMQGSGINRAKVKTLLRATGKIPDPGSHCLYHEQRATGIIIHCHRHTRPLLCTRRRHRSRGAAYRYRHTKAHASLLKAANQLCEDQKRSRESEAKLSRPP